MVLFRSLARLGGVMALVSSAAALTLDFGSGGAKPQQQQLEKRADPNMGAYLGAFFLGADPYVYLYLSDGNSPTALRPLNKGQPVLRPRKGTGGVRDPYIVKGGGGEEGNKWYIIGTDLNIGRTSWDAAQRQGSRGIFVWESSDLINWSEDRLVEVESADAGMVWAPEAIWDPQEEKYLVHWASKAYGANDPQHRGNPGPTRIRYAYTSDFVTFSAPGTYISKAPTNVIDLTILPLPSSNSTTTPTTSFVRFLKDESLKTVFCETTDDGLFGTWTRHGGNNAIIQSGVEGPAAYYDNEVEGRVHLLLDFYNGGGGYRHFQSSTPRENAGWVEVGGGFPNGLSHGSVLPITATQSFILAAGFP